MNKKIKHQLRYILLRIFNILYNQMPFFYLKNSLLKLFRFKIGKKSYIHPKARFFCFGRLTIGSNVTINFGSYIDARCGIDLGNNIMIAHNAKIYTLGHDYNSPKLVNSGARVTIEDNVCIFANVMIMPGVTIEEGAVVLPGAIVTKNVSRYSVVAGIPAKKIGERNKVIDYKLDYGYWFAN